MTTLQMRVGWAGNYADSGQIWHNGTLRQIISSDGVGTVGNIMIVGDYLVRPIDHGNSYMRFTGTGRRITEIVGWDEIRFGINGATNNVDITATGASFIGSITTTQAAGLGRATLSADGGWGAIALYYGADGLNMYVAPGGAIYHDASTDLIYRNGIGTIENARLSSMGNWTTRGFITSVIQSLSTDPTGSDLTSGQTRTIKNTSTGTTKVWLNDGGAFKSLTFV